MRFKFSSYNAIIAYFADLLSLQEIGYSNFDDPNGSITRTSSIVACANTIYMDMPPKLFSIIELSVFSVI